MSFFKFDGATPARAVWNRNSAMYVRFTKFWPTTTVKDSNNKDIEVYERTRNFYTGSFDQSRVTHDFVASLGLDWDRFISQDIDNEIETIYFELKPGEYSWDGKAIPPYPDEASGPLPEIPTREEITQEIIDSFRVKKGVTTEPVDFIEVTIEYGGGLKRGISEQTVGYDVSSNGLVVPKPLNVREIQTVLHSNPWYYFANSRHLTYKKNNIQIPYIDPSYGGFIGKITPESVNVADVATDINPLGVIAVLDLGTTFVPVVNKDTNSIYYDEEILGSDTNAGVIKRLKYKIKYKYTEPSLKANNHIVEDLFTYYNEYIRIRNKYSLDWTHDERITVLRDTRIKNQLLGLLKPVTDISGIVEDNLTISTGGMFQKNRLTYFKVDSLKKMKRQEFVKWLAKSIDTGYTVKEAEWWEKVLTVVIIIAAVIGAIYTGGATLVGIAAGAATASVILTIGSIVLSKVGGLSAASNVRMLGSFATVLGYVAAALGIAAFFQNMAQKAATEAAKETLKSTVKDFTTEAGKQALADQVAVELAKQSVFDVVKFTVKEAINNVTSVFTEASNRSIAQTANAVMDNVKMLMKAYDFYEDYHKKQLASEIDKTKDEIAEIEDEYMNRPYVQPAAVAEQTNERLTTPDMLQDLAISIENNIGRDESFSKWEASVNA